jgi:predicted metal-dependent phosphoesterase TrpH
MRIDHHIHTTWLSPDSVITPEQLIERARAAGLDAVVITEHDEQWDPADLADLQGMAGKDLLVLSGVEVSAMEGHFLVYGLPHLGGVEPGMELVDLLGEVAGHGGAIIAAHPFRWGQEFEELVRELGPVFHGLEYVSNNVTREMRRKIRALVEQWPMPLSGSSDAHEPGVVGCYHSVVEGDVRSMADFVAALRRGAMRPASRPGAHLASGPVEGE